ncbi:hypothetical protein M8J76_009661 [Diaphorina citri]|nr:hypothetical protein M8J76_009661 [Diaphorina citri]
MYENSCSYQTALDLKHRVTGPVGVTSIKSEMPEYILGDASPPMDWATGCTYRFTCNTSTFEQLKQSVEKAKAALQDTRNYSSAFSDLSSSTNYCTSTPTPPIPVTSSNSTNSSSLRLSNGQSHHHSSPNESDEPASNSDTKRNFNDSSSSKSSEKNSICANYTPSSVANSLSTSKSSYHQLTSSISDSLKFKTGKF